MSTAPALRELIRDVVRSTRGHDRALHTAGVTFCAIIGLVPLLLGGLWLAGLLAGTLFGEGLVRAFDRLSAHGDRGRRPLHRQLGSLVLLAASRCCCSRASRRRRSQGAARIRRRVAAARRLPGILERLGHLDAAAGRPVSHPVAQPVKPDALRADCPPSRLTRPGRSPGERSRAQGPGRRTAARSASTAGRTGQSARWSLIGPQACSNE